MSLENPTPLELSAASTGRRYFSCTPAAYDYLAATLDTSRGCPVRRGGRVVTEHAIPVKEDLPAKNGKVFLSVETWRITGEDDILISTNRGNGNLDEWTVDEYNALAPDPST